MIEIKDFFARFKNILFSEEFKRESVREIISKEIGVEIKKEDIKIKNNIIYLNISPVYKNEIFLKKEKIFLKLKEAFSDKAPENIV